MEIFMIKICKQCGGQLKPDENNKLCENCRKQKKNSQLEENIKTRRRILNLGK